MRVALAPSNTQMANTSWQQQLKTVPGAVVSSQYPGRCRSAGADLREALNAEREYQIQPQSLTLCPVCAQAGQCCPIAEEACCSQVLAQGPGSLPSSQDGEYGGFKKGVPVPTGLPAHPLEPCVTAQLHFHRLLLLASCHHWPDHSQLHGTMSVLQGWPEDSKEARDGLAPVFPLELLSGTDPKHGRLLETSRTGHRALPCGDAPQQPPRRGCRQWCAPLKIIHTVPQTQVLSGTESHCRGSRSSGDWYWGPVEVSVQRCSSWGSWGTVSPHSCCRWMWTRLQIGAWPHHVSPSVSPCAAPVLAELDPEDD